MLLLLMNYKYIVFDFNGTLVDSSEVMNEILNDLISKSHFKSLSPKDFEKVRNLPFFKKIKVIMFAIKHQKEFMKLFGQNLSKVEFANGVKDMLQHLNKTDRRFSILSSNDSDVIVKFFEMHDIPVQSVHRSQRLFGKKKAFKNFMKQKNCKPGDILYICDEKKDVEVCNACSIDVIFVNWGLDADEDLAGLKIKAVVHTPEELFSHIIA